MNDSMDKLGALGLAIPEILLPLNVNLRQWAVIACDQFTQDRDYWEQVKAAAGDSPSALNLIFPEIFLAGEDSAGRIAAIHQAMKNYLNRGIFSAPRRGCVYVERDTLFRKKRQGLVIAVDLEHYDWTPSARPLIRSTEGTVPERLPPRMNIRRGAPLETPHILLLIDDDTGSLLPALAERAKKSPPVYQTDLMMNSGGIQGWFIEAEEDFDFIASRLDALARRSLTRYRPDGGEEPFLFAAGDGNHSLAAAKGVWEEYKKAKSVPGGSLPDHPCRYALVEIENLYDQAIAFEPIHRVLFGMGFDEALSLLGELPGFSSRPLADRAELTRLTEESAEGTRFGLVSGGRYALIQSNASGIATAELQPLLDRRMESAAQDGASGGKTLSIDYIHGGDELFRLAEDSGRQAVGILLPPVQKAGLFQTVARSGPLPRKSFSMGEASEKRFYLECRTLFG
ncbi:MAG: DUF1015 domain-containing protein [Treponema sp.]|jgi:hypothetical protein|nr:DUF1015 domain-containing protein [Treponema sp.]